MSDETIILGPSGTVAPRAGGGDLSDELIRTSVWHDNQVEAAGIPITDTPFVTIGGGLGSLAMADILRVGGMKTTGIRVLGDNKSPSATYEYLAANSQIPDHERLRSDSSSVMDNVWGFPSYALREAVKERTVRPVFQSVTEPLLTEYFTPRAGQVYDSVRREAARIGWDEMFEPGYVRMVRKRDGGGYFVIQTPPEGTRATKRRAYRATFVHIAVGYPGVAFLPDLQEYRERTGDFTRVVNADEPHDHVYEETLRRPCTVLVRGSGIVGSRILQKFIDDRDNHGAQTRIVHLFRNYVDGPQGAKRTFRRPGANGVAYQAFNYPKAAWGGQLRPKLEGLEGNARSELLDVMGGTNTAPRRSWKRQLERGAAEGFYEQRIGTVDGVEPTAGGDAVVTRVRTRSGDVHEIEAQFIIDATGLLARLDEHRLMADLLEHSGAAENPQAPARCREDIRGKRNGQSWRSDLRLRIHDAWRILRRGRFVPGSSVRSSADRRRPRLPRPRTPNRTASVLHTMVEMDEEQSAMTPTIAGRIQTRLFLVAIVGSLWTLLIGPLLVGIMSNDKAVLSDVYRLAFGALVLVAVVGIAWELLYHALQQLRWEKDWPTLFGLLTGINEGIVVALLLGAGLPWEVGDLPALAVTVHFVSTWVVVWLAANGPMRVFFLRWRFDGGRLL